MSQNLDVNEFVRVFIEMQQTYQGDAKTLAREVADLLGLDISEEWIDSYLAQYSTPQ